MKALKSAGVLATSAVALVLMSTSAFADTSHVENAKEASGKPPSSAPCSWVSKTKDDGSKQYEGKVCFQSKGDYFWIKDMRKDGRSVTVRATYAGNPQTLFICKNHKGKAAGWTRCTFHDDMNEDQTITFNAQLYDGKDHLRTGSNAFGES